MGLDMDLVGVREVPGVEDKAAPQRRPRQFATWRKHWGLHAYVVKQFAGGMDEYDKHHFLTVKLAADDLRRIIAAIETGEVWPQPKPVGYDHALARKYGVEITPDIDAFRDALAWLEALDEGATRTVYYGAND